MERTKNTDVPNVKGAVEYLKANRVSFDIDGVEVFTAVMFVQEYNKLYGNPHGNPKTIEDAGHYGAMIDWMREIEEVENPVEEAVKIFNSDHIMRNADLVPGIMTVSRLLKKKKVVPYRITSRPASVCNATFAWYKARLSRSKPGDDKNPTG